MFPASHNIPSGGCYLRLLVFCSLLAQGITPSTDELSDPFCLTRNPCKIDLFSVVIIDLRPFLRFHYRNFFGSTSAFQQQFDRL